jgi:AraC-like DNA-binding protein
MNIQVFDDINASHAATGYSGRTDLPNFHIFKIEDTYPETRQVMPPYQFRWYQIVWFCNSSDAVLHMNTDTVKNLDGMLAFASPEHVLSWVRGEAQHGYIVYFKADFLAYYPTPIDEAFPFFRLNALNVMPASQLAEFEMLHDTFHDRHPYRIPLLQTRLLSLLFECRHIYDQHEQHIQQQLDSLVIRFRQLVNQHYLIRKTVQDYAEMLHISADHLSKTMKAVTGKTAHSFIMERVLLEAKKLLLYSDLTVAEIADYLGYSEPTHFGRFFRRYTGDSPLQWRNQH